MSSTTPISLLLAHALLWGLTLANLGCHVCKPVKNLEPHVPRPCSDCLLTTRCDLDVIEELYALAIEAEEADDAQCVELFLQVAAATCHDDGPDDPDCRRRTLHKAALAKLVETGQAFCKLDPRQGLTVGVGPRQQRITLHKDGFVWPDDYFHQLHPVGNYRTKSISNIHRCPGVGIPLVVTNSGPERAPFLAEEAVFAASLCMRLEEPLVDASLETLASQIRLELRDPLRVTTALTCSGSQPIVRDTTAPFAYRLSKGTNSALGDFIRPRQTLGDGQLRMLEPYQPGKIPVVLIHGLLSNPFTWIEAGNEMLIQPGFLNDYQIWVFDYPTGESFLNSAAALRRQLKEIRVAFDPEHSDPQFSRMVLVGHSMGGLVAKLQVTDSAQTLWRSVANRPFDEIIFPGGTKTNVSRSFFFESSPDVERVIFVGTPHCGSLYARRLVGRLGSLLARPSKEKRETHRELICCNPDVFTEEVRKGIPSSIDMLEPSSELLKAIARLPIAPDVRTNAIIGDYKQSLLFGTSDGVVSVESAKLGGEESIRYVSEKHGKLNKAPETIAEMLYLLHRHARQAAPILPDTSLPTLETAGQVRVSR